MVCDCHQTPHASCQKGNVTHTDQPDFLSLEVTSFLICKSKEQQLSPNYKSNTFKVILKVQ
jgi:hypothetical protein